MKYRPPLGPISDVGLDFYGRDRRFSCGSPPRLAELSCAARGGSGAGKNRRPCMAGTGSVAYPVPAGGGHGVDVGAVQRLRCVTR